MTSSTLVPYQAHRGMRLLRPGTPPLSPVDELDRSARRRVYWIWGLIFLNVLTFYKGTWNGLPLLIPIPSFLGKLITQGSLPGALLLAVTANRRLLVRPSVFLGLLTLLVVEAMISGVSPVAGHFITTLYRTLRLAEFVIVLWLITPWWGRRDLLLVKCHLTTLGVVLGSVLLGLLVSPGRAMTYGRLSGEFWPITPVQVADFSAVALGIVVVLWLCGEAKRRRLTLLAVLVLATVLLMTHTRTELVALVAGILVAGLRMFTSRARVRRVFASVGIIVSLAIVAFSGALTTWLARGESSKELTGLTGRTRVWGLVLAAPRDRFQLLLGYGLSNKGYAGLPIDSTWIAAYYDLGIIGVSLCIAMFMFVFASAYFQQRSAQVAVALFLVTYVLVTSFTETGISDASVYLLELALAASLIVPPLRERRPG